MISLKIHDQITQNRYRFQNSKIKTSYYNVTTSNTTIYEKQSPILNPKINYNLKLKKINNGDEADISNFKEMKQHTAEI